MSYNKQIKIPIVREELGEYALPASQASPVHYEFNNAEGTVIHQELLGPGGVVLAGVFSGVQNDCPRNVIIVDDGVGPGNSGDVIVTGIDQFGDRDSETIAIVNLGTAIGLKAWTYIESIEFPAIADTDVEAQQGSIIGMPADLSVGGVTAVAKDIGGGGAKAFVPITGYVEDDLRDTITETGVPIVAGDIFDFYVKVMSNA